MNTKAMRPDPIFFAEVRADFAAMQSRSDLAALLNKVSYRLNSEKSRPIATHHITWLLVQSKEKSLYKSFSIAKKSGGKRTIHAPVHRLLRIQRLLAFVLQCVYQPHPSAMGFVWGRSVVTNAKLHTGKNYVYNLDLKDFFPSVSQARVRACLMNAPFNLNEGQNPPPVVMKRKDFDVKYNVPELKGHEFLYGKRHHKTYDQWPNGVAYLAEGQGDDGEDLVILGSEKVTLADGRVIEGELYFGEKSPRIGRQHLASLIAQLCCTEMEVERFDDTGALEKVKARVLPQGAATSPVITNIVCQRLDRRLSGLAKRFGLVYTRYADDITFSSHHNVYNYDGEFITELHRIIDQQGFRIKSSKTRLQKAEYRQEVTGVVVNQSVNVRKRYIREVRKWLYLWKTYGYQRAEAYFLKDYQKDKEHVKKGRPSMEYVLRGKLDYLMMVRGEADDLVKRFRLQFQDLSNTRLVEIKPISVDMVLDTLYDKGLDAAFEKFEKMKAEK
jgi:hypothetical protein